MLWAFLQGDFFGRLVMTRGLLLKQRLMSLMISCLLSIGAAILKATVMGILELLRAWLESLRWPDTGSF